MCSFCGWGQLNEAVAAEGQSNAGSKINKQNLYMRIGIMFT